MTSETTDLPLSGSHRDVSFLEGRSQTFSSLDAFLAGEVQLGLITIEEGGLNIDVLYEPAGSDTTIVIFHAALSRQNVALPIFTGRQITQDGPVNRIYVSDPGLYADPELTLSWYAGTSTLPLQTVLPPIIERLAKEAGGSRLMFFGASGGGFASLYYSRLFPESLAVAVNPQTVLRNFPSYTLRQFTERAFPGSTQAEVLDHAVCSDLRVPYAQSFPNYVVYIQNESDDHVEKHFEPFLEAVRESDRLAVVLGNWGEGHVAPPNEYLREFLSDLTGSPGTWRNAISALKAGDGLDRSREAAGLH